MAVLRDLGQPVTEVASRFEVDRSSVAFVGSPAIRRAGWSALADRSHRPATCPHQMAPEVEALVCDLRRQHPFWGPVRLAHEVGLRGVSPSPSRSGVYRALLRHRLVELFASPAAGPGLGALGTRASADGAVADGRGRRDPPG